MPQALIIFVRKPEIGKVKSRIAATEGPEAALRIYKKLLHHTHSITAPLACDKYVFYAGEIDENDIWTGYHKMLQPEAGLGQRMKAAFDYLFKKGYKQICIIGSDCYQLTSSIIESAFEKLCIHDIVMGPAHDSGYYLLGMKEELKNVWEDIEWSTEKVWAQTMNQIQKHGYTHAILPMLHDVDVIDDVPLEWLNN